MTLIFLARLGNRSPDADRNAAWLEAQRPLPLVDVLICTYNEEEAILERTIVGALSMDYPRHRVWVLDDGRRAWLEALCRRLGSGYLTRPDNAHAKAGNINNGLAHVASLPEPPDLIVSGLNAGSNAGINVLYSGTVAAAIEGAFFQRTSIAVSLEYIKPKLDFARGADLARRVIEQILVHKPGPGTLFNVNIPSLEKGPIRGIRALPQNLVPYVEGFDRRVDPRGRTYFWTTPDFRCPDPHPDTDVTALGEGYISVTPLQFNLTHQELLEQMSGWQWRLTEP